MENNDKKIILAGKAIVYDTNGKILTIRRSATAGRRALTWDLPGGNLEFGERVTVGYTAKAKTTNVVLSYEHDDFKWVTKDEFFKLDIYEPHRKLVEQFELN